MCGWQVCLDKMRKFEIDTRHKNDGDIMKRFLRNKASNICFVIGMVTSFLSIYFGNQSIYKYCVSAYEARDYHFTFEKKTTWYGTSFPIDDIPSELDGNCMLHGLYCTVDAAAVTTGIWICLYAKEPFPYQLKSGHYPTEDDIQDDIPPIVIGSAYEPYVVTRNETRYIFVQGEVYRVTGCMQGRSDENDDHIMLFAQNLGGNVRSLIRGDNSIWGLDLVFQSNEADVEEVYEALSEKLLPYGDFVSRPDDYEIYTEVSTEKNYGYYGMLLYCVIVMVLVSIYWVSTRKRELLLKRVFGYSTGRLIMELLAELIMLCVIALGIGILAVARVNHFTSEFMHDFADELALYFISAIIFVLFSLTIPIIYPVYYLSRKSIGLKPGDF